MSNPFKKKSGRSYLAKGMRSSKKLAKESKEKLESAGEELKAAQQTGQERFASGEIRPLYEGALSRLSDFDQRALSRQREAQQTSYAPLQENIRRQMGDFFGSLGQAGRRSSRGQFAQAMLGEELARQGGRELYQVGEQARARELEEQLGRLDPAERLTGRLAGFDVGKGQTSFNVASAIANVNTGLANQINQARAQQANITQQESARKSAGFGSLLKGALSLGGSFLFSDRRLKKEIKPIGKTDKGLKLYKFKYKGDNSPQIGLMAQDVAKVKPKAVVKDPSGYLKVNYKEALK